MRIVMVRHGKIDPTDKTLLDAANPPLDLAWINNEIPNVARTLEGIKFAGAYCGTLDRMFQTLGFLARRFGLDLWNGYDERLNATSTYHEGVIYGSLDRMTFYMPELLELFKDLVNRHGPDATVLLVTSGARMAPARALARKFNPKDEQEMFDWTMKEANASLGEAWAFVFDPDTGELRETSLEELKSDQRRAYFWEQVLAH